ncbi:hypothetical protein KI387_015320, partial [Taxus chinensis]
MGCEVPIVPKGKLENILASEALARAREGGIPFAAADWMSKAYNTVPPHLFSPIKFQSVPFLHTNHPGTGSTMVSHAPLPLSNSIAYSASHQTFPSTAGGGLGALCVTKDEENLPCSNNLETKRKKRIRNRPNGSSRKKTKTDSSTDLVLSNEDGKPPSSRSRKRLPSTEKSGKTSSKRQSCRGIKGSENDPEHKGMSLIEKDSALQRGPNSGSNGILDVYGLKTMPIDLSNHIRDISINDLLSQKFHQPQHDQLGNKGRHGAVNCSLVKEVNKILQLMPKSIPTEDKKPRIENSSNLGFRSQFQEFGRGFQYPSGQQETCAMDASEEPSAMKFASSSDSVFPMARFPLYPMHDFVSRLGLPPNEALENLIVKPDRQPDINNDPNSQVSNTGSIPPLQHSTSLSGGSRAPLKNGKESMNQSRWLRAGIVKLVNGSFQSGSALGLATKSSTNVEGEQKERERGYKHTGNETTERAFMIDLNVESFEQLDESSMADAPNSSLLLQPTPEKLSSLSLNNTASEGRKREENTGDCTENLSYGRIDHSMAEDENLRRGNKCLKKEANSEELPALRLEALRPQTSNIQDVKNDIGIERKLKTIQSNENFTHRDRGEEFEELRQEPRNLKEVQASFSLDQNSSQLDKASQHVPFDLPTLQLDLDKGLPSTGMPSSPRVEAAARILFDMAISQSHNNVTSLHDPQEDSCDILQQVSRKGSTNVQGPANANIISESNFTAVEEYEDGEIKAPIHEKKKARAPNSILLIKKYSSKGTEPEKLSSGFQNKTLDSALRNHSTKQGSKDAGKQYIPESEEVSDTHIHCQSSRPSRPIRDDGSLKPVLSSKNQYRGNLQPKSLAGGKMHISSKSNQNMNANNGNHKFTLSREQNQRKIASVGHVKSSRSTPSFRDRK